MIPFFLNDRIIIGDNMNIIDIIDKKRIGNNLSKEEIQFVVDNYLNDFISDCQMSALLMAICINGMNEEETINLTNCMLNSGDTIDLSKINEIKIDKHSTGGIGDKTTLIIAPLVAACGVKVAKMSGRGLGYTGGTIDKLESIPNFNVNIENNDFIKQVNDLGVCICYAKKTLVPADKKIYALRDVTGTVNSIPLIASSIMSKKLASGCDKIVIDLKVGNGAFMKNLDDARILANLMIKIGENNNKEVICVLSNMNQPLGNTIGNSLEVKEAIETLLGKGPKDLTELSIILATHMVALGKNIDIESANKLVKEKLNDMSAYKKFLEFVKIQNGDLNKCKITAKGIQVLSCKEGYINKIDSETLGEISMRLGAGRNNIYDSIDYSAGIIMNKKIGDYVKKNELLATLYTNKDIDNIILDVINCYEIDNESKELEPLIYEVIK